MATTAESYSVKRASPGASISLHPAFPAISALWFAALLGFGSLALPDAMLEGVVRATGLASLIPSAAPPLGFTAHVATALAWAIVGALAGLVLARKVTQARAAEFEQSAAFDDEPRICRPISVHDELDEEGLAAELPEAPAEPGRRKSLAVAEDVSPGIAVPIVPLPGLGGDEPGSFGSLIGEASDAALREPLGPGEGSAADGATEHEAPSPTVARQPLAEMGLLQLTERLGAALAGRAPKAGPPFALTPDRDGAGLEAAHPDDAVRAMADFFADLPGSESPGEEDSAEEFADGDYSSLLAMKNPFSR